ncbi:MAG: hypothetical protein JNM43_14445 [Planctomycetaceae bacterium]|nr:hypothetical protein [Planctomycetaceae bacterium]
MNCLSRMSGLHHSLPGEAADSHCRMATASHDICSNHCQVERIACASAFLLSSSEPASNVRSALLSETAFCCAPSNRRLTLLRANHRGQSNAMIPWSLPSTRPGLFAAAVDDSSMSSQPTVRDSERKLYHEKGNAD